jgi:hypothetical protein
MAKQQNPLAGFDRPIGARPAHKIELTASSRLIGCDDAIESSYFDALAAHSG